MQRQENTDLCYTCERRSGGISKREPDQIFPLLVRPIYQNLRVRDLNGFTDCILIKYLHPSLHIRNKYINPQHNQRLEGCTALRLEERGISGRVQECIIMTYPYHWVFSTESPVTKHRSGGNSFHLDNIWAVLSSILHQKSYYTGDECFPWPTSNIWRVLSFSWPLDADVYNAFWQLSWFLVICPPPRTTSPVWD